MARSPHPPATRGFSLVELLVVITIIGIIAAMVVPSAAREIRERAVQSAAQTVGQLYRSAQLHSRSRGAAVVFIYDKATRSFSTLEAVQGNGPQASCQNMPVATCPTTAANATRPIETFTLAPDIVTTLQTPGNLANLAAAFADQAYVEFCFTPSGRVRARLANAGVWTPMTFVAPLQVERQSDGNRDGLARRLLLLPNGLARLGVTGS